MKKASQFITASYKVWAISGQVTIAKCLKSGKFVKLSLAQKEYEALQLKQAKVKLLTIKKHIFKSLAFMCLFAAVLLPAVLFTVLFIGGESVHNALNGSLLLSMFFSTILIIISFINNESSDDYSNEIKKISYSV